MRDKILLFIFAIATMATHAQVNFSIDTSYTVKSAFKKEIKKYPIIKIKNPETFQNVTSYEEVVYKNLPNRSLHLDSFIPKKEKKLNPAVLLIHGGGWKSGTKSHMIPMAQTLASKGYSCFAIEYRLSPEAKYPAGIYDIKNAIQFVKENYKKFKVDTTQIAILGCSSGGQMAALVGSTNNNAHFENPKKFNNHTATVQAIINLDGILAFHHPQSAEGEMAAFWLDGTYAENSKNWNEASALTHVNKQTPPTLFINSQFERFHAGRDEMTSILKQNKTYFQVETIPNSPHSFWLFEPYFDPTINYITEFLHKIFK